MLKFVKVLCSILLIVGISLFCFGFFGSTSNIITFLGIGVVTAAVYIFIMGMFFKATEEAINKLK